VLCAVAFDGVQPGDLEGQDREFALSIFNTDEVPTLALRVLALTGAAHAIESRLDLAGAMLLKQVAKPHCGLHHVFEGGERIGRPRDPVDRRDASA
jgi:hypothetical protein